MYIGIRSLSVRYWLNCTVCTDTHITLCNLHIVRACVRVCLRIQTFKNVCVCVCLYCIVLYSLLTVSGVFKCSTLSDFVFVLTPYLTQMDGELCHQTLTFMHEHTQYGIRHGCSLSLYFFSLVKFLCNKNTPHTYNVHYIFIHAHMPAH